MNNFDALIQSYLDETLTDDEARELHAGLKEDPAGLEEFIRAVDLHATLAGLGNEKALPTPAPRTSTRRASRRVQARSTGSPWTALIAVAAGLLFAIFLTIAFSGPSEPPTRRQALEQDRLASEAESRRAAERLREIEQKKNSLTPTAKKELDQLNAEKERVERDLRDAVERSRRSQEELAATPERPAPPPSPPPTTVPVRPATQAGIATLDRAEGEVYLTGVAGRVHVQGGESIEAGATLETVGDRSFAVFSFPDRTRFELRSSTVVRDLKTVAGKQCRLDRGDLRAVVVKQPAGAPMVVASPHGEAKVVGTTLRLIVENGTRLEVEEGRVELKNLAGKMITVESGHYAVAAVGLDLVSKSLPISEILLSSDDKRLKRFGGDWKVVKDPNASAGAALEAAGEYQRGARTGVASVEQIPSYVYFAFTADADTDYYLWVRGECLATADRTRHDAVVLQSPGAQMTKPPYANVELGKGPDRATVNGYGHATGYWWIGGDGDYFDSLGNPVSATAVLNEKHGDESPTVVRFPKPGPQVLRLYAYETPVRIDTIWLSTTQKTRPEPGSRGPMKGPK